MKKKLLAVTLSAAMTAALLAGCGLASTGSSADTAAEDVSADAGADGSSDTADADGKIHQAEITSCGLHAGPLRGQGEYPAYIACHLFTEKHDIYVGGENCPRVMQDGRDGDQENGYIANMQNGATAGFKYFDINNIRAIAITTRGYAKGYYEIRDSWYGDVLATVPVAYTNVWEKCSVPIRMEDGKKALYLTFKGEGSCALKSFELI